MKQERHLTKKKTHTPGFGVLAFFCVSIALAIIVIVSVLLKAFERDFVKETLRDLESTNSGIMEQLSSWANVLKGADSILASRPAVQRALLARDEPEMKALLLSMLTALDVDRTLLTDEKGMVVCASHGDIALGTDFSAIQSIHDAIFQKKTSMSYNSLPNIPCGEFYASPLVESSGKVIGTLVLIYDLTAERFIKLLDSYGIESTIFWGKKRVASTLKNVVGTELENPAVEQKVLKQGQIFVGKAKVGDLFYYAVYTPLKNDDGTIGGMYFVARERVLVQKITQQLFKLIVPLCAVIIFLLISVLIQRVIHDRKALLNKIMQLGKKVDWDVLTCANTRQFGMDELSHYFENFVRGFQSPAIMLLDVDNFKSINDTYGHEAGDLVLKQLVQTIYGECRTSDKLIRWGGDEFVGIYEGMRQEVCKRLAENVLKAISSMQFVFDGKIAKVTVSIGFSYFRSGDMGYEDALNRADDALYQSKKDGKNTYSMRW